VAEIRFCAAPDGVRLAYSMHGRGPPLVRVATWLTHLERDWGSPVWRHWLDRLGESHTVVRYDERGCGLSDAEVGEPSVGGSLGLSWRNGPDASARALQAFISASAGSVALFMRATSRSACVEQAARATAAAIADQARIHFTYWATTPFSRSALASMPLSSSSDIAGHSTSLTPALPMTLGSESATP